MKSRSLQGVLAGAFFLMILLPLAGVTFWGGRVLRSHLGGFGDREVMVLARSIAEEAGVYLQGPERFLALLSQTLSQGDGSSADLERRLGEQVEATGYFHRVLLLDPRGRVVLSSPKNRDLVGIDYSRQPFFLPDARAPYWTSPQMDPETGDLVVALGVPWPGGVVVGLVSLQWLGERLERISREGGVDLILQDRQGGVVFRSGAPEGSLRGPVERGDRGPLRLARPFDREEDGVLSRCGSAEVPGVGWRATVCRSMADLMAPTRRMERILEFLLLGGLALAIGVAWGILRWVRRPLRRLERLSQSLAEGKVPEDLKSPQEGFREIAQVERAFEAMVQAIHRREEALRVSEERYALAMKGSNEGLWDWDILEGRLYVSPRWKEILGLDPEEPMDRMAQWEARIHPEDRDEVVASLSAAMAQEEAQYDQTFRMRHGDGTDRWIRCRGVARYDGEGNPVRMAGSMGEVTGQVETEKQLRLAASVFENAQEGILVTDREGTILSVNRALCAMTGYDPEELRGQNPRILKSGVHDDAFYKTLWDAILNQGSWQGEIWNRHKDGRVYPEWLTISAVRDYTGRVLNFVAITRDLTERKRYEERIAHEATHDALTGLPNRRHFLESLQRHLALADRSGDLLGVLFMDLDGFKGINDTLGHDVGDRLLCAVAERLQHCVRASDLVARMGGDEFTFLLPQLHGREDMRGVAGKILLAFREPFALGKDTVRVSASIGGALFPLDDRDLQGLLKLADMAMYRTKERGRNGFTGAEELLGRTDGGAGGDDG